MKLTYTSKIVHISIEKSFAFVNDFLANPENFQKWASGLGKGFSNINGEWYADTPDGQVRVVFTEKNEFGILDHYVYPKPNIEIYVPMRVFANSEGCDVQITLFHLPEMDTEKFAADVEWVLHDLKTLKEYLEHLV